MNIQANMLHREYNGHTIAIDQIDEIDIDGNIAVRKLLCTVIDPHGNAGPLRVSPYLPIDEIHTHAIDWCDEGCPGMGNPFAPAWA